MTSLATRERNGETGMEPSNKSRTLRGRFQIAGAVIGLAGSVIAVASGGLLSVSAWLVTNEGVRHWLSTAATVMFILTIPLIILAAFCLDWADTSDLPRRSITAEDEEKDEW